MVFFTAICFILLKTQIINARRLVMFQLDIITYLDADIIIHDATYSVHDGFSMPRRTGLAVFLLAPWKSRLLRCCRSTAI